MIFLFFFVSWAVFLRILFKSGDSFFVSPIIFILIPSETTFSISSVKYLFISLNKNEISFFGRFQFSDEKT